MLLPEHLTTEVIRDCACGILDKAETCPASRTDIEALYRHMDGLIEVVTDEIAARLDLDPEQAEELQERICWRLELLPPVEPS